jgi:hypothetical protein
MRAPESDHPRAPSTKAETREIHDLPGSKEATATQDPAPHGQGSPCPVAFWLSSSPSLEKLIELRRCLEGNWPTVGQSVQDSSRAVGLSSRQHHSDISDPDIP